MKVLVTGGTGFLGRAIVERLVAKGDSVRAIARRAPNSRLPDGVELHQGDISTPGAVASLARGCDVVFHCAAIAGIAGPPEEYRRINVEGTERVVEACRRHGVPRLVHTSTPSVVFDGKDMEGADESAPIPAHHDADYPATKAEAERIVLAANSPVVQ